MCNAGVASVLQVATMIPSDNCVIVGLL